MLGLLGLRIFEATGSNIQDLGEEHGHRVLRVRGKGDKVVLAPLPPAVGRAIERSIDERTGGPILTFVTTMLDADVDLRDVQIAARHADPRTTMRYDRARKNLDRHPTTSSPPTWPPAPDPIFRSCR
jgi:integrase/recombinase XerD